MDIDNIRQQIYALYGANKGSEAEALMLASIAKAQEAGDDAALLQLLNELLGYYRETSRVEDSYRIAEQAAALAEKMGLAGSVPYATTLLNAANAYRAGGRLADSLACYEKAGAIYGESLAPDDMLIASLENNKSLLHQEAGDFAAAKECLLRALTIVTAQKAAFEEAVTYANLAGTCMQLDELEEARDYADRAIWAFREQGVGDAHFGAALSALGAYHYKKGNYAAAEAAFLEAMGIMEVSLGRNDYYYRLEENVRACREAGRAGKGGAAAEAHILSRESVPTPGNADTAATAQSAPTPGNADSAGLSLCRAYYEAYGRAMIAAKFPEYEGRIAVGLAGEGSDCFGFDDSFSKDHDFGPDFCMWVTEETYAQIGEALQAAYEELPRTFHGVERTHSPQGSGRRGVMTISSFCHRLFGAADYDGIDFSKAEDASVAAAVNGEIFRDDEGIFTALREKLKRGYPEPVLYVKLAQSAARFSQAGQYNFQRMQRRGDGLTAFLMLGDCVREAMKLQHYLEGVYPPHDKWLRRSLLRLRGGKELADLLADVETHFGETFRAEALQAEPLWTESSGQPSESADILTLIERIGAFLAKGLYAGHFISDIDPYLDSHTEELLQKSALAAYGDEELAEKIAELEFEAFDKVKNVGGRASCQNDWATFSIMRKSQYLTWERSMLLQYLYDFYREYRRGHNLITEKYGRMMESTAREEYESIKGHFPELSEHKRAIIEEIVRLQVGWMEAFAAQYPALADNARSIHTSEDHLYNTSYETYLRGEISTYSDKMLELYGRYVVECAREGGNLAEKIMGISCKLYGYKSLEAAEKFLTM